MTYNSAVQYLFDSAPLFQNVGAAAYKEGLGNTHLLDEQFGHPHRQYRTIHVGGTNGKGSVSHTLAAILQAQGYRVGLYTSPHLVDFRERIKVNGEMISKERVIDFVTDFKKRNYSAVCSGFSFFELATALAFQYFSEQKVDFAVIEVGLGGRLDCTNIIMPELSIVTNISFDHVQFLGDTLPKIASEKAGIIKTGIPACIGENANEDVKAVFANKAKEVGAPITFAEDAFVNTAINDELAGLFALKGFCQEKNIRTILTAVRLLQERGIAISDEAIRKGLAEVCSMTGLMGRWQTIDEKPLTICDTGHNVGGMQYIVRQLQQTPHKRLHIVIGMVNDKDVDSVLRLLPTDAVYYFTQASVKRAMPAEELARKASHLQGAEEGAFQDVPSAYRAAKRNATTDDLIFIGGSTFVVADLLADILPSE
ncbi:MAG: bifunctional folylpolyglutamate synthase/dihydrofolate synthase [Bacteroidaceae bacterium]|nr:bifunctional folylpolyglutamate synthase/dihydrofolate synthase [Bacteroidaceae bacterium]